MRRQEAAGITWACAGLLLMALLPLGGCQVKETTKLSLPPKIIQAKNATPVELRHLVNRLASEINSIQCADLVLDAQAGTLETPTIEKYRSAPGYLFLSRPKQVRLKIQVPLANTTLFDMASDGEFFQIWYPRENKFFIGSTHIRRVRYAQIEKNPLSKFRPQYLVDALLFEKIPEEDKDFFIYEDSDGQAKYYVIGIVTTRPDRPLALTRRVWIERSNLHIARQQYYELDGSVMSDIAYDNYVPVDTLSYPSLIRLERPGDKFSITLRLKTFKINQPMTPDTFTIAKPPTAALVEVKADEAVDGPERSE